MLNSFNSYHVRISEYCFDLLSLYYDMPLQCFIYLTYLSLDAHGSVFLHLLILSIHLSIRVALNCNIYQFYISLQPNSSVLIHPLNLRIHASFMAVYYHIHSSFLCVQLYASARLHALFSLIHSSTSVLLHHLILPIHSSA